MRADAGSSGGVAVLALNGTSDVIVPVDITDGFVIGSNQFDDAGGTDKDKRAFFNKVKGAFRAGSVTGTQWNDASIGIGSHAEGGNTTASGNYSHAEGLTAIASGLASHAEGEATTASGNYSHSQNKDNVSSGAYSHAGGWNCTASGAASHAGGQKALASRHGQQARSGAQISTTGDAQTSVMTLVGATTDATVTTLTANNGAATYTGESTNVYTLAVNTAATFELLICARRQTTDEVAGWKFTGMITRPASGSCVLVGLSMDTWSSDSGSADTWAVAVTADTTNQCLKVAVTGQAAKNIGWIARLTTAELAY